MMYRSSFISVDKQLFLVIMTSLSSEIIYFMYSDHFLSQLSFKIPTILHKPLNRFFYTRPFAL